VQMGAAGIRNRAHHETRGPPNPRSKPIATAAAAWPGNTEHGKILATSKSSTFLYYAMTPDTSGSVGNNCRHN
uniref:hypothetical protein n=1 Tax=Stenotrophomonas maltophilia TaxID=40324 RepID=UPI001953210B